MRPRASRFRWIAAGPAVAIVLGSCSHLVVLRDPLTANEHNDLGVAYESSGQSALAIREYRKSLSIDSHQGNARINLGNAEAAEGRWRDAEKSYRRALLDAPGNADAQNNLAVALLRQGRNRDEARALAASAAAVGGERDSIYRATVAEVDRWQP
jgi:Flp pilus assembly protein TadD